MCPRVCFCGMFVSFGKGLTAAEANGVALYYMGLNSMRTDLSRKGNRAMCHCIIIITCKRRRQGCVYKIMCIIYNMLHSKRSAAPIFREVIIVMPRGVE